MLDQKQPAGAAPTVSTGKVASPSQRLVAKFAPGLFGAIRVYRDGTSKSRFGTGSVIGATARVDQSGSQRLVRDTRQTYLTIEGPRVANSVALASNDKLTVSAARKFAATVNQVSHRKLPDPQSGLTAEQQAALEQLVEMRRHGIVNNEQFQELRKEHSRVLVTRELASYAARLRDLRHAVSASALSAAIVGRVR